MAQSSQKIYPEFRSLDLVSIHQEVLDFWAQQSIFAQSITSRSEEKPFVFYEGPPSANGLPGIHHVMARTIKDIFCRYKTLQGYRVERKAGWDTHGLPVELQVEKELGITKEDIGKKISIEEYNRECRKAVMKYTGTWNDLTEKMGYWVDMEHPYVTYENKYIESVWWLLQQFYNKELLYKGYTIQPYSPAAGTGLSTHELNQPGAYRPIKDTTIVAMFRLQPSQSVTGYDFSDHTYILAWTTTPWTLPSNTALAVGKNISYVLVDTFNPYTGTRVNVILAKDLLGKHLNPEGESLPMDIYQPGDKKVPYRILKTFTGSELEGLRYEQLLPYTQPVDGDAFRVVIGDFVSTEDGTGIVHIAPSHGADDFRTARQNGIGSILLVDKTGRFTSEVTDMAGEFVKEEYWNPADKPADYKSVDVRIAIRLKESGNAFRVEKYEHSYPHCWRTDKPVIYYPLDSWFIRSTAIKEKLISLNRTIQWKPESTGTGRFGNWLENLQDWNLSRSRYWGIPIPIWSTEDGEERISIGSVAELKAEIEKSVAAGVMQQNPLKDYVPGDNSDDNYHKFDLHRPVVDEIVLVSPSGKPMKREADLIDVWFDSGSMPYAQLHYPFENKELVDNRTAFPADFIAEGVDQTRGWFFTLHVIAAAIFDSVAYKTVVSNGLVLDKNGQKMSKRLGNAVDPFDTIGKYGADAVRWYMITNAQPWDNLKFDLDGITEVQRKFFGTLYNTYSFFALYANVDQFVIDEQNVVPVEERPEFDQWIISELQTLIKGVTAAYEDYDPTTAGRLIQEFTDEILSNWYVRLSRRRFWRGEMSTDKRAAYETLFQCLMVIAQLMAPVAPFFADWLYRNLTGHIRDAAVRNHTPLRFASVHLTEWTKVEQHLVRTDLENSMHIAQRITSLVLSLRKKEKIRVRQPLQRIMLPVLNAQVKELVEPVKSLILSEVNVKELEYIEDTTGILVKKIKPDFKKLGPRYGRYMKEISAAIAAMSQEDIATFERNGSLNLPLQDTEALISLDDVEIHSEDIPGWLVASENGTTIALDIQITESLRMEGIARDLVNRLQNLRKETGLEVTDRITVKIEAVGEVADAIQTNFSYICAEILADTLEVTDRLDVNEGAQLELEDNVTAKAVLKAVGKGGE